MTVRDRHSNQPQISSRSPAARTTNLSWVLDYRDDYGIEVDAIVQLCDGRWGAIDIKLGEGQVDAAATNLKRFAEQIDSQRSGSPAFLAVICGKGYGYRQADGVCVVPVGVLGP